MKKYITFFRPDIRWYRNQEELSESPKYHFYRAIQPSNPNIHFVRLTIVVRNNNYYTFYQGYRVTRYDFNYVHPKGKVYINKRCSYNILIVT